jgi:hypothetical protein
VTLLVLLNNPSFRSAIPTAYALGCVLVRDVFDIDGTTIAPIQVLVVFDLEALDLAYHVGNKERFTCPAHSVELFVGTHGFLRALNKIGANLVKINLEEV